MVVCYLFASLWCDDKFRMCDGNFRTYIILQTSIFHYACHSYCYIISCMMNYLHKLKWISTSTTCHVHLHSKSKNTYMHIFRGSPCYLWRQFLSITISHTLSPLKTSTSLSSITKKGEIVSASSATPSWFWSIDDKVGWGTNAFVRIAG